MMLSVKEAREILGEKYIEYTDEQITQIIINLESVAEGIIDSIRDSQS